MEKMLRCVLLFILLSIINVSAKAQTVYYTDEDRERFEQYLSFIESKRLSSVEDLLIETGIFFLNTPYVAATLEKEPEGLVVNLREMDCATLVDNVLALVRTVRSEEPSFETFCSNLKQLRYRNAEIGDYTDRLHYTTDWVYENSRKNLLRDVTKEIGGVPFDVNLSFMSTHPDSYKQLKENPKRIALMKDKEQEINKRVYYYIPEIQIEKIRSNIQNGDIICFTTTIKGLDISHVGIAYWVGGKLTFIHASTTAMKVIINEDSLVDYIGKIKRNNGIIVVRPSFLSENSIK